MPTKKTKQELILELAGSEEQGKSFGRDKIRSIQGQLRERLGPSGKTSEAYVAQILVEAGGAINYPNPFVNTPVQEPYGSQLQGALRFGNLTEAEKSLTRLQALYTEYLFAQDRTGTSLVRKLIAKGKDRARSLAGSTRVTPRKREEKDEIARWFSIWLDTPDLFFDWLEVRKKSEGFRRLFGANA